MIEPSLPAPPLPRAAPWIRLIVGVISGPGFFATLVLLRYTQVPPRPVSAVSVVSDLFFSIHARVRFLIGKNWLERPMDRDRNITDITDVTDLAHWWRQAGGRRSVAPRAAGGP